MKTLTIALMCCCVTFSLGFTFQEEANPVAGEGKCLSTSYPELGVLESNEEAYVLTECLRLKCEPTGYIAGAGCGSISSAPDGCTLTEDLTKKYPYCCPDIKC